MVRLALLRGAAPVRARFAALAALGWLLCQCATAQPGIDSGIRTDAHDSAHVDTGCTSNAGCVGSTAGPICDTTHGVCVGCLSAPTDTCASGQYCNAMNHCTAGCRTNTDCGTGTTPMQCDTATHHCVGCTHDADCAPGTVCSMGSCLPGCSTTHPCGIGTTCCNNACVSTGDDANNCGACGHSCGTGVACCTGTCANTSNDSANCGACGRSCPTTNATEQCAMGACAIQACARGFSDCDFNPSTGCEVQTDTDVLNCGACRHPCPYGTNSMATCATGACGIACTAGFGDCDGNAANGCESTLNTDPMNCGGCGMACTPGANAAATCAMGVCGQLCNAGFGDCDGNAANGCETNLQTTPTACAACGNVCSFPNAVASCTAGSCGIGACATGWGNCDGSAANGCETPLTTNTHCGACASVCSPGSVCSGRTCGSVCTAPTSYCAGTCVNTTSDLANCGSCGHLCPTPFQGSPSCSAGACGFTCNSGFGDCDGNASNGCETTLSTTITACGMCGHACAPPANATAACVGGACGIGACNAGFANCDGTIANGCESNLNSSITTCGACGNACPTPANGTPSCTGGTCGIASCTAGFGNCDGILTNGCETLLSTSNANCGACGTACGPGTACSGGTCSTVCVAPTVYCAASGMCANLQTDGNNCGSCGMVCAGGTVCTAGVCVTPPPANDRCASATPINLSTHSVSFPMNTVAANHDLAAPCTGFSGADVFFSFTLTQPELVYADTFGTAFDTVLFFANNCSTGIPVSAASTGLIECDDDAGSAGCSTGGLQSQVTAYLQPGSYYLVVAGYSSVTGTGTVNFMHEPVGNDGVASGAPGAPRPIVAGTSTVSGTTAGTGLVNALSAGLSICYTDGGTAGSNGNGPEDTFFWRSCPETLAGSFTATSCASPFDTLIYEFSPASGVGDCDDDNSACVSNTLASILPHPAGPAVSVPAGAGLHVFYVDGYATGSLGAYSVTVSRP